MLEGAEVLGRMGQPRAWRGAAWLSMAGGDVGRQEVYSEQCLTGCLMEGDWETGQAMVKELPNMSWAGLLLQVHRAVVEVMEGGGKRDQPLLVQLLKQVMASGNLDVDIAILKKIPTA